MKVKIVRNTMGAQCWYANHVGEVFDAREYFHFGMNTGDYETMDPDAKKPGLIASEDGEVLPEGVIDGKCPHCGHPVSAEQIAARL